MIREYKCRSENLSGRATWKTYAEMEYIGLDPTEIV
jgi:hypothetical protein